MYIYIYIHIYMVLCIYIPYFHIESWSEWDSNPRPCDYRALVLIIELTGRTMRCG